MFSEHRLKRIRDLRQRRARAVAAAKLRSRAKVVFCLGVLVVGALLIFGVI